MRSILIGFAAGVCWLQMQSALPDRPAMLLLLAGALALVLAISLAKRAAWRSGVRIALMLACGAAAGFLWAALCAHRYLADELPKELEGQDIVLVGTIHSLPYRFPQGVRFNFAVESAQADGRPTASVPPKLALSWYASSRTDGVPAAEVQPGERWQLKVHLQRPHGSANLGGFDYEVWLLEQGLRATGAVRTDPASFAENRRIDAFVWNFNNVVERARGWMRDRILAALPDKKYAGVMVALVVGDERGVGHGSGQ